MGWLPGTAIPDAARTGDWIGKLEESGLLAVRELEVVVVVGSEGGRGAEGVGLWVE